MCKLDIDRYKNHLMAPLDDCPQKFRQRLETFKLTKEQQKWFVDVIVRIKLNSNA